MLGVISTFIDRELTNKHIIELATSEIKENVQREIWETQTQKKEEAKQARENEKARKKEELEELRQNMEREKPVPITELFLGPSGRNVARSPSEYYNQRIFFWKCSRNFPENEWKFRGVALGNVPEISWNIPWNVPGNVPEIS